MTKKQIISKYEPVIDEYLHHRTKAINRRREIELQKLDNEIEFEETMKSWNFKPDYQGEYSKQKQHQARYGRIMWRVLWLLCGLVLLMGILI